MYFPTTNKCYHKTTINNNQITNCDCCCKYTLNYCKNCLKIFPQQQQNFVQKSVTQLSFDPPLFKMMDDDSGWGLEENASIAVFYFYLIIFLILFNN